MTTSGRRIVAAASVKGISAVVTGVPSGCAFVAITLEEAEELMKLCEPGLIDKTRYLVKSGNHTFEVDEFYGDNEGLVMAEVELQSEDEPFEKPDFIGQEVTGDRRYYNGHLARKPFKLWGIAHS